MVQDMGKKEFELEWHKTKYPGVRFIYGTSPSTGDEEKIFYVDYRRNGKRILEKAGRQSIDGMTAAKANQLRSGKMEGRIPSNKEQREADKALKERPTIDKIAEQYFKHRVKVKSIGSDKSKYNVHISPILGAKIPEDVDPLSLERFRSALSKTKSTRGNRPISKTTVHHVMAILRAIVNWGAEKHLTTGFPGKIPVPPMPANMVTEDLSDEQLRNLLDACDQEADQDAADILRLAIFTGARRAEIMKLKWEHVDLEKSVWLLVDRKDYRTSGFPLPPEAVAVIRRRESQRTESQFVFPGPGRKSGHITDPRAAFARIKKAAKLPDKFRLVHGLRHRYASSLVSQGVDLFVVSKLLGHSTPELTAKRYAHLRPGVIAEAAKLAGKLVSDVAEKYKENAGSN